MSLYYELEFKYLINVDICNRSDIVLEVFFYDQVSINQTVFNSVLDAHSSISNSKWNGVKIRFKIATSGRYYLAVLAQGYCEIQINDAFIAVDSIELYEYSNLPTTTTSTTTTTGIDIVGNLIIYDESIKFLIAFLDQNTSER